jgi:hypothetical protein
LAGDKGSDDGSDKGHAQGYGDDRSNDGIVAGKCLLLRLLDKER